MANRVDGSAVAEALLLQSQGLNKLTHSHTERPVVERHTDHHASRLRTDPSAGVTAAQAKATGNACRHCGRAFPSLAQLRKHARACTPSAPYRRRPSRPRRGPPGPDDAPTTIFDATKSFTQPLPSLPDAVVLDTIRGDELLSLCASFRQHCTGSISRLATILEPLELNLAHYADEIQVSGRLVCVRPLARLTSSCCRAADVRVGDPVGAPRISASIVPGGAEGLQ